MNLPFTLDNGSAETAAFGIIVLQTDETLETEFRGLFDRPGVALYHSRIPAGAEVTPETLKQMQAELPRAAALLPNSRPLDVIAYACTSGATIIGPDNIAAGIQASHPGVATTDPMRAVIAACAHLKVTKLGFITPYIAEVSQAMRDLLQANGLEIANFGSFEQQEDAIVARITPASLLEAICVIGENAAVDAVFASCTNLRSFEVIEEAEARIGKPVITSNQALAWHMAILARYPLYSSGPGRLFQN